MEQLVEFVMNHHWLAVAWVMLFLTLIYTFIKGRFSPVQYINPQQLTLLVNKQEAVVFDIRTKKEFDQGRIAGAKHIAMDKIQQNDLVSLEKHKSKPIIVVCKTGMTASSAAKKLYQQGFSQMNLLEGGMASWQSASLPLVKR